MSYQFIMPKQIFYGQGALEQAAPAIAGCGGKALIVTDPVMVKLGNVEIVTKMLEQTGVGYAVYEGVTGEPTDKMVEAGLDMWKQEQCDFLIAVGGGSPIDTMKAIGVVAIKGGSINDWYGKEINGALPPMAAIPTTSGTGSEATQFTIITDTKKDIKMLLKGKVLMPDLAVCDPQFTLTAPPKTTAATGLDALCHAMEAYTSRKAQPLSDTFALSAVKRIFAYLPKAFHTPDDMEAREEMALAALEAGAAFNNASVTLIHGMSRPIGALFHVAHGLSNAMLIPVCLTYALPGAYERFGELARPSARLPWRIPARPRRRSSWRRQRLWWLNWKRRRWKAMASTGPRFLTASAKWLMTQWRAAVHRTRAGRLRRRMWKPCTALSGIEKGAERWHW